MIGVEMDEQSVISVNGLSVDFWSHDRWTNIVQGVKFAIQPGSTLGLVGESGCGKTTTAYALLGYNRPNSRITKGEIIFKGRDLLKLSARELQSIRGKSIGFVPQDPTTALSPAIRVGGQIIETLMEHNFCSTHEEARSRTLELFRLVSLPEPERISHKYPFQLSGGQQQRVVIAMALACNPELVVLDEPTTGLDVTTQAQILSLIKDLRYRFGMTFVYVTHNLGVVAQICDHIGVMYAGRIVELAPKDEIFRAPSHPYTQGLIASVPHVNTKYRNQTILMKGLLIRNELPLGCQFAPRCEFETKKCFDEHQILASIRDDHYVACWRSVEVPRYADRVASFYQEYDSKTNIKKVVNKQALLILENMQAGYGFTHKGLNLKRIPRITVDDVTLEIFPGETLALVGESGSGKTTIARTICGLLPHVSGRIEFDGCHDLKVVVNKRSIDLLRSIQVVFQNPDSSLSPRQRVSQIIGRPVKKFFGLSNKEVRKRIDRLLKDVHLDAGYYSRFPDELSGGERQRVAIARALAAEPRLLLCDEIVSALDVSVQASILMLLEDLQAKQEIAILYISHDLAVVRSLADRIAVMYWGLLCEIGDVRDVFESPNHPYTSLLLKSIPEVDLNYEMPDVHRDIGLITDSSKSACPFAPRCILKLGRICLDKIPPWQLVSETHRIRCHIPIAELSKY